MRDTRPLEPARKGAARPEPRRPEPPSVPKPAIHPAAPSTAMPPPPPAAPAALAMPGLDKRSQDRLRKGRMRIEGRLDLHGHTQADAHRALIAFVQDAYARDLRCILVITGKGADRDSQDGFMPDREKGVLRRQVPLWLAGGLGRMVLAVESARPQHGGDGAYYVLLRRRRTGG